MAAKFIVSCLLVSSSLAAPQQFLARQAVGSHTQQTVRTPFGTLSSHQKTVAEADGTSHVHRFDTRHHGAGGVVRVARPRIVQTGPFAVQALPSQTPFIVGGNGATPVITAARGSSNLFQTPDGRIFAFSNGNQPIVPGQLFQTPDGRFFTTAVINQDNAAVNSPSNVASNNNNNGVLEVRDNQPAEEEEPVPVLDDIEEEANDNQRASEDVVVTQDQTGLPRFAAVPTQTVVARAPLTPATARFVATPAIGHSHAVVSHSDTPVTLATRTVAAPIHAVSHTVAAPARAVATPLASPVNTFALADTASTGFFTFPGAGIAFNF